MRIELMTEQFGATDERPPRWWREYQRPTLTLVKTEASARSGAKENALAEAKGA